uniref:Uncharacterized protein n=1 Tax=Gasterosteus aculeatus TaxID=69293 RepID=G3N8X2_GASAC
SSCRRSREDRSPSVEIVYEGTAPPPARKRRRKRQRRTQPSSLPVIITLDSDSSLGDDSSLISSQRTVDFSDLPPLPGPLPPADVLDRGSEVEPGGPVAVDNISDVDVEGSGSLLGSDDDVERPIGKRDTSSADVSSKRDSEVLSSDSCLLATILNDLEGMAVPPVIFDPGQLANAGAKCARDAPPLERLPNEAEDITLLERPQEDVPPKERPQDKGRGHHSFWSVPMMRERTSVSWSVRGRASLLRNVPRTRQRTSLLWSVPMMRERTSVSWSVPGRTSLLYSHRP